MGNGPSLDLIDFEKLKKSNVVTFSCNLIASICERNNWYPDFYTSFFCEPFRGTRYSGSIKSANAAREDIQYICSNLSTKCYLHEWYREFISPADNIEFHSPTLVNRHEKFDIDAFSKFKTPERFLWHIATTPLFQICFQMGIKEIGIIGQDGHRIEKKPTTEGVADHLVSAHNHFKNYSGPEQPAKKIPAANNRIIELHNAVCAYTRANETNIVNLSNVSIIDHYPKMDIDIFLSRQAATQ